MNIMNNEEGRFQINIEKIYEIRKRKELETPNESDSISCITLLEEEKFRASTTHTQ